MTSFSQANAKKYADVIAKALGYVKTTLDFVDDIYALAIATYAAQLANHPSKSVFLQKLDKLATVEGKKTEFSGSKPQNIKWNFLSIRPGDLKYWEMVKLPTPSDPWCQPPSVNVEITAYALLSYIKAGRVIDGLPIMRWLLSQQSSTGGFSSTQDTVENSKNVWVDRKNFIFSV